MREYGVDAEREIVDINQRAFDIIMEDIDRRNYYRSVIEDHQCHLDTELLCPCDSRCCLFPKDLEWSY